MGTNVPIVNKKEVYLCLASEGEFAKSVRGSA